MYIFHHLQHSTLYVLYPRVVGEAYPRVQASADEHHACDHHVQPPQGRPQPALHTQDRHDRWKGTLLHNW